MARPRRCRRICRPPVVDTFLPCDGREGAPIRLNLEEYEVLRLVDLEEQTHQECAARMEISRSTVQEICQRARKKVAAALVHGRPLIISGGNYRICTGREQGCERPCCRTPAEYTDPLQTHQKGEHSMKIAVTYENGQIYQHFGHTAQFKLYQVEDGKVVGTRIEDTNGSGHGALAGFLMERGVELLICGGIGGGARMALAEAGIRLCGGVSGDADQAVEAWLSRTLVYDPDVCCSHHDHHGEGHTCGDHGCGSHGCH